MTLEGSSSGRSSHPLLCGNPVQSFSYLQMENQSHSFRKMFHTTHTSQSCWKLFIFVFPCCRQTAHSPALFPPSRRKRIIVVWVSGQNCFSRDLAETGQKRLVMGSKPICQTINLLLKGRQMTGRQVVNLASGVNREHEVIVMKR